jgi:hypothetical protein
MVKIAFQTHQLDVRGTCIAIYDYAHNNEELLKNESIILIREGETNDQTAVEKFTKRFTILSYKKLEDLEDILVKNNCDIIYTIKYGKNDEYVVKSIPHVIHCVFEMNNTHGTVYAGVSEQIAKKFNKKLFVPHMIGMRKYDGEGFRKKFNIPESATVFARYGGMDTFNVKFIVDVVNDILKNREDIYFLFMNTPIFINHPRVIFLDKSSDIETKSKFIATSDAMIVPESLGHSFGLACGEFSVNNKPIIVYNGTVWNDSHLKILGDKAITFSTAEKLYNILDTFNKDDFKNKDLNCYKEYSPEKVMKKFEEVFIKKVL